MHDYLTIAAIAGNGAVGGVENLPAFVKRPLPELVEHAPADGFVADDAAARHIGGTGLELGLEQDHALRAGGKARGDGGQHLAERNEGDIGDKQVERGELGEVAGVRAFHGGDARVLAQALVELPAADVDGDNGGGAALQEAVGEAAGGGANVEAAQAVRFDAEGVESGFELTPAAADVGLKLGEVERRPFVEHGGGFHEGERSAAGAPGHDEPPGGLARLGEAPVDEQLVGANASHPRKASA